MSDSQTNDAHLGALEERWKNDPGSRIYLQLAEEYRKRGRHTEALEVLEQGLARRPRDLSGLVVLGRCRLETGEIDAAVETLQQVIERDAAHIVANKLLAECYLLRGDADAAAARLEICRLLSDSDPDLDSFEQRLRQLRGEVDEPEEATPPPPLPGSVEAPLAAAPETSEDTATSPPPLPGSVEAPLPAAPRADEEAPPGLAPTADASADDLQIFALGPLPPGPDFDLLWEQAGGSRTAGSDQPFAGVENVASDAMAGQVPFEPQVEAPAPETGRPAAEPAAVDEAAPASEASPTPEPDGEDDRTAELEEARDEALPLISAEPDLSEEDTRPMASVPLVSTVAEPEESAGREVGEEPVRSFYSAPDEGVAKPRTKPEQERSAEESTAEEAEIDRPPEPVEALSYDEAADELSEVPSRPEIAAAVEDETEDVVSAETVAVEPVTTGPAEAAGLTEAAEPAGAAPEPVAEEPAPDPSPIEDRRDDGDQGDEIQLEADPGDARPDAEQSAKPAHEEPATATLGELYLRQGHREEAEKIFRRVLQRDPGNAVALAGLKQVAGEPERDLTAADLLASAGDRGSLPAGVTARKILVLKSYMEQLRSTGQKHVH